MKNETLLLLTIPQRFLLGMLFFFSSFYGITQERTVLEDQSEELGKVHWYRDYEQAVAASKKEKKPIALLFQEVPGCATCSNYGHNVLSHPLMVEVLENSFIPLAIFNNKGGKDRVILNQFKEPSWNNPVVRIIDAQGKDVVQRISNDYSAATLSKRLKESLNQTKTPIPEYLNLLVQELSGENSYNKTDTYFKMFCFWDGEKQLGKQMGVLDVEAGFAGGHEVVKVTYDNRLVNKITLVNYAQSQDFEVLSLPKKYRPSPKDQRYYLQHSTYQFSPLSELQKTKINSALGSGQAAENYLSPQQQKWLVALQNKGVNAPVLFHKNIVEGWGQMGKYIK